jgi:hypothetical protein
MYIVPLRRDVQINRPPNMHKLGLNEVKVKKKIDPSQLSLRAAMAQSVQRLATGWTVRGSTPGGCEIFDTRPYRPMGSPSFLYIGYRAFFPGVKRPGRGVNHPPPSSA